MLAALALVVNLRCVSPMLDGSMSFLRRQIYFSPPFPDDTNMANSFIARDCPVDIIS